MSVAPTRKSVTNTATRLDTVSIAAAVAVQNRSAVPVYLGDSAVTTATGFQLDAGASITLDITGRDSLYAIAATAGPHAVHVLTVTR